MQKFKFSYDEGSDDLFLFSSASKSKGSIEIGDLILDFNSKKELVGLQIINASKFIQDVVGEQSFAIKDLLADLKACSVEVKVKSNLLIIKVCLASQAKEISPVFSVPRITETSPALAYA